jgi:hypothetical protein
MSDRILRLTAAEAKRLRLELMKVVERYREDEPGSHPSAPKGAEQVIVQVQLLPRFYEGEGDDGDDGS